MPARRLVLRWYCAVLGGGGGGGGVAVGGGGMAGQADSGCRPKVNIAEGGP